MDYFCVVVMRHNCFPGYVTHEAIAVILPLERRNTAHTFLSAVREIACVVVCSLSSAMFFSSWKWRQYFSSTCIIHEFKMCDWSKVHRKPAIVFCLPPKLTKNRTELLFSLAQASIYWLFSWFLQRHNLPNCQADSSPAVIRISFILFPSLY